MSGVSDTKVLVQHDLRECKCELIKVYVIQSKNSVIINVD